MRKYVLKFGLVFILFTLVISGVFAVNSSTDQETEKIVVVASTAWTGSIAKAAGADEVRVLAPFELKHPPEYDFKPSDIYKLTEGSFLVWGGYEPFIPKIIAAAGLEDERLIKVTTTNTPENLIQQVKKVAGKIDRLGRAEAWIREFTALTNKIKAQAEQDGVSKIGVLVQIHQQAFAEWLGYNILSTYSGDLSLGKISQLAQLEPDLIIDNYHTAEGLSIAEVARVHRVELRNFPQNDKDGLIEVFSANAQALGIELGE